MSSRASASSSRWAAWAVALVLLLKAAVPLLATASAHAQGKTLVEVCTVYGVATVALDGQDPAPAHDPATPHAAEHCALGSLVALGATGSLPAADIATAAADGTVRPHVSPPRPDAAATWVARLKHGPPRLA